MDPDDILFCPQPDCDAAYMIDGLPKVDSGQYPKPKPRNQTLCRP